MSLLASSRVVELLDRGATNEILARATAPGAYGPGMVAPTTEDYREKPRVRTGELVSHRPCIQHVLGVEAARALVSEPKARPLVCATQDYMEPRLHRVRDRGRYCCGLCSVALGRFALALEMEDAPAYVAAMVRRLELARNAQGWQGFPFFYTLLLLSEAPASIVAGERRFARYIGTDLLRLTPMPEPYRSRRTALLAALE